MARVGLIGNPLKRPHSAIMHNAAFQHFGIDAHYDLIELPPEDLDVFFDETRTGDWLGFNVTAPHKQEAIRRCDRTTDSADRIGAVNTVTVADGELLGSNTDAPGFARSVAEDLGRDMTGLAVAVAGAGGAARAVVAATLDAGAESVAVGARQLSSATTLAAQFADSRIQPVALGPDFDAALSGCDLAVNATTVGMIDPGLAFDPALLPTSAAVFDLVYVPAQGELVTRARARGLDAVNGIGMLVGQAEIAFESWTGVSGAGPVMRAALDPMG